MYQKRGEILKGFKGPFFLYSAKMPLLITTKLKDGGEGGHLALFSFAWDWLDLCPFS